MVFDSNDATITQDYSLNVDSAITVSPGALAVATVGDNYSAQLHAMGGSGTGYVFTASGLPSWLTLSSTGLLSGKPPTSITSATNLSFNVTATDSLKTKGTTAYSMTVDPALTLLNRTLPAATVGNSYFCQLSAAGGSGEGYTFKASGLPAGITLSSAGLLTGTPKTASTFTLSVVVTDGNGGTLSATYSLTVRPPIEISPGSLPEATLGEDYRVQFTASGGIGPG